MLWTKVLPIKHGENFQSPKNVKVPETNFVDKGVMVKNVKVPVSLQMLKYQSQKSIDFVSKNVARAEVWFPQDYRNEIRGLGLGLGLGAGGCIKQQRWQSKEKSQTQTLTTCLADKTNHPVERLSLNRSQCGSCSTKYDTSAGT